MNSGPQREHQWLQRLVGHWTYEARVDTPEGPKTLRGSETVRPLGDFWVLMEGQGEMPDGTSGSWLMLLGYDTGKGRFVGTWAGSMMGHLWLYEGSLEQGDNVLPLNTEGPAMAGEGRLARYCDVIEVVDEDHRLLGSLMLGNDGQCCQFQVSEFRRAG